MTSRLRCWLTIVSLLLLGSTDPRFAHATLDSSEADLVNRALAAELARVVDTQHPLRYTLHKASPRLSTTKEIVETKDGAVARLIAINDKSLSTEDAQKEQARLDGLLNDPGKQRHRKQAEDDDTDRVLKVMRALPRAFRYQYIGPGAGPHGKVERFALSPNPGFDPAGP